MSKHAVVVLAESDTPPGRGRMAHAMRTVAALKDRGEDVALYFEGAGVNWIKAFADRDHPFTQNFCSSVRFETAPEAEAAGVPLLGDGGHHDLGELLVDGVNVTTF